MYKIGICDDMPELCDIFHRKLLEGNYTDETLEISIYHSAQEIIDAAPQLDILFLDIEMPEMSGVELLRQYEHLFEETKVVFLTSHSSFAPECFEVNAYRFLNKPAEENKLHELFRSIERESVLSNTLTISVPRIGNIQIRLKDIIYMESRINHTLIVTTKETYKSQNRLKEILPLLPEAYFYQTHRSYVVNLKHILRIKQQEHRVLMSNNDYAEIAFRKVNDFISIYMRSMRR